MVKEKSRQNVKAYKKNQKAKNSQSFLLISKSTTHKKERKRSSAFRWENLLCVQLSFFFLLFDNSECIGSFLLRWVSTILFCCLFFLVGEMKRKLRPTCVFRRRMPFALDCCSKVVGAFFSSTDVISSSRLGSERNI